MKRAAQLKPESSGALRRVRPEDITLSNAEKRRAAAMLRRGNHDFAYVRDRMHTAPVCSSHQRDADRRFSLYRVSMLLAMLAAVWSAFRGDAEERRASHDMHTTSALPSPRAVLLIAVSVALLLLLAFAALPLRQWLAAPLGEPAIVTITLPNPDVPAAPANPPAPPQVLSLQHQPILIAQFGTVVSSTAVRADPISTAVSYTIHGQTAANQMHPVVQESDVQPLLDPARTGLHNRARDVLAAYAEQSGLALEVTTLIPGADALDAGSGYTLTVQPAVGQPVDPQHGTFSLKVQCSFSALATPPGSPLDAQLAAALPAQLARQGRMLPGMPLSVVHWHWDGTTLMVDGVLSPTAALEPQQTRSALRDYLKGKSRAEAEAALAQFRHHGVIADYRLLTDRETLPRIDRLLDVQLVPAEGQSR
jgi:hypothetical protein